MEIKAIPVEDPAIFQPVPEFDFQVPPTDPEQLADMLYETMLTHRGIGLSANQLGLPYRVFVLNSEPKLVCFNPRIVDTSTEMVELEEGCLSFPKLVLKIKRPKNIRVRYENVNGQTVTDRFDGLTSRVVQHEIDHLNGIPFTHRASKLRVEMGRKRQHKLLRGH